MPDTGWLNPGTIVSDASAGTAAWIQPSNAAANDGSKTTSGNDSQWLLATNFGANVPTGNDIVGVEVQIERQLALGASISAETVQLYIAGAFSGNTKSNTSWTTTDTYETHGGATDLWGATITRDQANSSTTGFGLRIPTATGTLRVDHMQIKFYYAPASSSGGADGSFFLMF